jgi:indole-3-acetate monooxygenase
MIAMHAPVILSLLPRESFDDLFASTPDLRARVALAPRGTAVPVSGGYLISGQWPFASGGPAPHLFAGGCFVPADDDVAGGMPQMVVPVLPADEVEFLDTWNVVGMKGTNSCDVAVDEVFVPEHRVANLFTGGSCLDGPMAGVSFRLAVTPGHVAVALGIARGARDDVGALAATKRSMMNPAASLGDDPAFQRAFGELAVHIEAADAMLGDATAKIWDAAATGQDLDPVATLQATAVAPYGTALCVKAIDTAYSLAGSASLCNTSPLQRRLRDIHVATQHVGVSTATYQALGAALVTSPEHGQ